MIFEKGKKFRYCFALTEQKFWHDRMGGEQEVEYLLIINGLEVIQSKVLETGRTHRFDVDSNYAKCCVELDETMDNGLPYFW